MRLLVSFGVSSPYGDTVVSLSSSIANLAFSARLASSGGLPASLAGLLASLVGHAAMMLGSFLAPHLETDPCTRHALGKNMNLLF